MKKVLPGGGTVIGIPKKQVMKFNIVTGFQNLVCFMPSPQQTLK